MKTGELKSSGSNFLILFFLKWKTKEWKTTRETFSMENKEMENKECKTKLNTSLLVK